MKYAECILQYLNSGNKLIRQSAGTAVPEMQLEVQHENVCPEPAAS